jgi:hypothetical protein
MGAVISRCISGLQITFGDKVCKESCRSIRVHIHGHSYVMDRRLFHVSRCCLEPVQFGSFLTVDVGIALVATCMGDDPRISVSD